MSFPLVLGADNGLAGGLCIASGSLILAKIPMPVKNAKKGREVDVLAVWDWLYETVQSHNLDKLHAVVEEPGGAKSYKAAVSMAASFHALRSVFELKKIKLTRITPQQWQKKLLNAKKGDTKPAALRLATKIWPDENWLRNPRCTSPHDGMIDAALICHYAQEYL